MKFEENKIYYGTFGGEDRVFMKDGDGCKVLYIDMQLRRFHNLHFINEEYKNIRLANDKELESFYATYPELKEKDMKDLKFTDVIVNNDDQSRFEKIQQWFFDQGIKWQFQNSPTGYLNLLVEVLGDREIICWAPNPSKEKLISTQEFMDLFMQSSSEDSTEYTLADFLAGKFEVKFDTPICESPNFDKVKSWVDKKRKGGIDCSSVDYQDTNQYLAICGSGGMMSLNYGDDEESITEEQFIKLIDADSSVTDSSAAKVEPEIKYGVLYREPVTGSTDGYIYYILSAKNESHYEGVYYLSHGNKNLSHSTGCQCLHHEMEEVTEETPHINRVKHMFSTKEYISQEDFDVLAAKVEPTDTRTGYYRIQLVNAGEYIIHLQDGNFIAYRNIETSTRKSSTGYENEFSTYGWKPINTKPATEEEIAWLDTEGQTLEDYLAKTAEVEKGEFTQYDVFHVTAGDYQYLVRQDDAKGICEWLDLSDGRYGVDGSNFKDQQLRVSTPVEQARFYNQFGYKSDTGEVWKVGDRFNAVGGWRDNQEQEIKSFFVTGGGGISAAADDTQTTGFNVGYFCKSGYGLEHAVRLTGQVEKVAEVQEKPDIPGYEFVEWRKPLDKELIVSMSDTNPEWHGTVQQMKFDKHDLVNHPKYGKNRWIVKKKSLFAKYESLINYLEEEGITEEKVRDAFSRPVVNNYEVAKEKLLETAGKRGKEMGDAFKNFDAHVHATKDPIATGDCEVKFSEDGINWKTVNTDSMVIDNSDPAAEIKWVRETAPQTAGEPWRDSVWTYSGKLPEKVGISEKDIDNKPLWYRILKTTKKILIG